MVFVVNVRHLEGEIYGSICLPLVWLQPVYLAVLTGFYCLINRFINALKSPCYRHGTICFTFLERELFDKINWYY